MNKELLEYEMRKRGDTLDSLAAKLGMSRATLCYKKNGKSSFTVDEIKLISELYDFNEADVIHIFFSELCD